MITIGCRKCGSPHLRKNGHTKAGAQKYYCRVCGCYGTLVTQDAQRAERDALVIRLAQERVSQRAMARIARISRNTVIAIVKKK
jgi:transposase-like protein